MYAKKQKLLIVAFFLFSVSLSGCAVVAVTTAAVVAVAATHKKGSSEQIVDDQVILDQIDYEQYPAQRVDDQIISEQIVHDQSLSKQTVDDQVVLKQITHDQELSKEVVDNQVILGQINDAEIKIKITKALSIDPEMRGYSYTHLAVSDGVVLITGDAASEAVKAKIINTAQSIKGVKDVKADILIKTAHSTSNSSQSK